MKNTQLSNLKLVVSGLLIVNVPVLIVIFSSIYFLSELTKFNFTELVIISCSIGWIFWEFASRYWIKWSLSRAVEKERLLKIGISSLVLWKSDIKKIEKIHSKLKEETK
ncbi:hypothetical protein [Flavobacterium granuli]|uniref:Uncharacterized protein n=1 Tax=Flavobacterium granuli TaxID=280093 RepID=A0ABU1S8J5_9FLAO|nr:hypothetical protein [Flavobacterium granuli]MDR6846605.1 hypothetical protein [Flavobacterium granuli]